MAGELEGDIKVPAVGKVSKKVAYGSVAVVGVLIVVYYYRQHQASSAASAATSAAAAATSADQYPPDGTTGNPDDPYSTDPATGQTYGDESVGSGLYGADSALADEEDEGETDTYPWDGSVGDETDPYSLDPATGVTFGDEGLATGGSSANPSGGPPFANNSDWENYALTTLQSQDPSVDTDALTTALGLYLNGQPVTAAQQTLVFDATGIAGDPPVAGANGYPPAVRTNGSTGGSGSGGSETVPDVKGDSADGARQALAAVGLVPSYNEARKTGTTYTVTAQSPAAGTVVADGSTVKLTVTATGTTSGGTGSTGSTGSTASSVTVPVTYGESADDALAKVRAAGFTATTSPLRNPKDTYVSTGSKPEGGTKAAKGSQVVIGVKQTSK